MLDKIVISKDRHSARIYFETHSVGVHSDGDVTELIEEIVFAPSRRLEEKHRLAEETTAIIDMDCQMSFDMGEAA